MVSNIPFVIESIITSASIEIEPSKPSKQVTSVAVYVIEFALNVLVIVSMLIVAEAGQARLSFTYTL